MRWLIVALLIVGVIVALARRHAPKPPQPGSGGPAQVRVYFSPKGGGTDAIVRELRDARREVLIQAYLLASRPIAEATVAAHKRGVNTRVVLDPIQEADPYESESLTLIREAGISLRVDRQHKAAHNKVMVIDGRTVITGSFNFTDPAEDRNAENLLVLKDAPETVKAYRANFEVHEAHAVPYERRPGTRSGIAQE